MATAAGIIGKGIEIKGELRGQEDLVIEGRVEGNIALQKHLIVEETGVVQADVQTENITVKGQMNGNMEATNRVLINNNAKVFGDIKAPRVVIEDGASYQGNIEMEVELPPGLL